MYILDYLNKRMEMNYTIVPSGLNLNDAQFNVNPLKTEILLHNIRSSVRTSQETRYVAATKTNRLMLFGEIICIYCENSIKHINTLCRDFVLKQVVHIVTIEI
jgi:thioredoxin-related protein